MEKVKALIGAGASIPTAIKESLPMPAREFGAKYGFPPAVVSDLINGNRRASKAHIAALMSELGGTEAEWRELLWQAGKPAETRASA